MKQVEGVLPLQLLIKVFSFQCSVLSGINIPQPQSLILALILLKDTGVMPIKLERIC